MLDRDIFKTLALRKGDITFDNHGKLKWFTSENSIAQTVNLRLGTMLGDLFYDESYGFKKENVKNTVKNIKTMAPEIRLALIDEEKIVDADLVDVIIYNSNVTDSEGNFLNGYAVLKIAVTLYDQSREFIDFNLEIGGADNGV